MPKVKFQLVFSMEAKLPKKVTMDQLLEQLEVSLALPHDCEASIAGAEVGDWTMSDAIPASFDINQLLLAAKDSLNSWDNEEDSVKEEHADTIKALRRALKGVERRDLLKSEVAK